MSIPGPGHSPPANAPAGDAPADDPLRLEHCPACGYALQGLAREGVCPECGVGYDQSEVVLHGYGTGGKFDLATARPVVAAAFGAACVVVILVGIRDLLRGGVRDPGDIHWPAILAGMLGWSVWKRSRTDMPGLVQVRLSAAGAVQIDNPVAGRRGPARMTPWHHIAGVHIRPVDDETARIKLVTRKKFLSGADVVVEADVRCDEPRAQALAERVEGWQRAARSLGSAG